MASIREQLRQLEDVNEGMFDENARYETLFQLFMNTFLELSGIPQTIIMYRVSFPFFRPSILLLSSPASNPQYKKHGRIVDMLSKVGQNPTPPTPGTPNPSSNDNSKPKPVTDVPSEVVEAAS